MLPQGAPTHSLSLASPLGHGRGRPADQRGRGLVSDLKGETNYLHTGNIITGTPKVFALLLQIISHYKSKDLSVKGRVSGLLSQPLRAAIL